MQLRRNLATLGLFLVTMLLLLALLEGAARLFYHPTPAVIDDFRLSRSDFFQPDSLLGWLPRPNIEAEHPYLGRTIAFHTNSRGLRDREYATDKQPGVTRVLALGDSYTWGYRVGDEETYPSVLESLLPRHEVINLGVTAFMTEQELQYYLREGIRYSPDIVLLAFCLNDYYEATGDLVRRGLARLRERAAGVPEPPKPDPPGWLRRLKRESMFIGWLRERVNTNRWLVRVLANAGVRGPLAGLEELDVTLQPALVETPAYLRPLIERAHTGILELRRVVEAGGGRFILMLIPSPPYVDDEVFRQSIALSQFERDAFDRDKPSRALEAFAAANHIELINPLEAFRARHSNAAPLYLVRDMHFSPQGHDLFAREIAGYLSEPRSTMTPINPP